MSLDNVKILILGAGGLGCEIVKTLALFGIPLLHIVDMDTIELTNLNRQFLFTDADIGKPKAHVAASAINNLSNQNKLPRPVHVVGHNQDLTSFQDDFIAQFDLVISGLDSIEARRWMNYKLHELALKSNYKTLIPFIDGATEGLMGNCKLIIPGFTACYECSLTTLPQHTDTYPLCTLASNPRSIAHCVQYASIILWPRHFNRPHDLDNSEDLDWLYEQALQRAQQFNIDHSELSPRFVLGVLKSIIPSVTTTNAIIAGQCCKLAIELLTDIIDIQTCPTFTMYNAEAGATMFSYRHERDPQCSVCCMTA
ncbi:hypothetical protein C6P41_002323 [Kluyveromyces marxianus]|nr:hypothetical protein C6P43_002963 [Kluyveromyces marxianus]KAG0674847.1 hypothetical protein C6P41_002323 [Kluyveromyces marxianus]